MASERIINLNIPKGLLEQVRHNRSQQSPEKKQARIDRCLHAAGLSSPQLTVRFDNLDTDKDPEAHRICRQFAKEASYEDKPGLLLAGPPGCGKTTLAVAILQERVLVMEGSHSVRFINLAEAIDSLRPNRTNETESSSSEHPLTHVSANGLVILDDFGKVKRSEWVDEQLYRIVDQLYRAATPVVITTNVAIEQLTTLDPPLSSRLLGMTTVIEMSDHDFRVPKDET